MQALIALLARSFEVVSVSRVFFQFGKAGIGIMGGSAIVQIDFAILHNWKSQGYCVPTCNKCSQCVADGKSSCFPFLLIC